MNKHHSYNNIIERKLEQLSVVETDHLWHDMHAILDKKMPQKKERRRFIFWFPDGRGSLVLAFVFLLTGSTIFFLSTKQNASIATKKQPDIQLTAEPIENELAKVSEEHKENKRIINESNQSVDVVFTATSSLNTFDKVTNDGFATPQKNKTKDYVTQTRFSDVIQVISKDRTDYDIISISLESIRQNLDINSDHNKEIDSLIRKADFTTNNVKLNNRENKKSGLYAGVMFGVDLSSIHFQSVKTGSTKGFIIGYAFNKKISIESGLLSDTKRVYDNGSFFNPPGYTPSNGIEIVAVNGRSRLYEWPVNLKYTIISGKHNLFTTTGLSSYFMKSENYDYEYTLNNQPGGHNYLSYKNETKNWFSVVNLGFGYSHKLGTTGTVRVEPYLKIPIKDLGVGNMPIMSTGLNIGFTKQIR